MRGIRGQLGGCGRRTFGSRVWLFSGDCLWLYELSPRLARPIFNVPTFNRRFLGDAKVGLLLILRPQASRDGTSVLTSRS
jgi:hypothetical protein